MRRIAAIAVIMIGVLSMSMRENIVPKEIREHLAYFQSSPQSDMAFMKFEVIPQTDLILLEWSIPNDVENPAVSVERSNDGKLWEEITQETTGMELEQELLFTHMDQVYESGVYYYRLFALEKQKKVFSNVQRVVIQSDRENEVVIEPAVDDYHKELEIPEETRLDLFDYENKLIRSFKNKAEMDLSGLDPGLYILRFNKVEQQPIVII